MKEEFACSREMYAAAEAEEHRGRTGLSFRIRQAPVDILCSPLLAYGFLRSDIFSSRFTSHSIHIRPSILAHIVDENKTRLCLSLNISMAR